MPRFSRRRTTPVLPLLVILALAGADLAPAPAAAQPKGDPFIGSSDNPVTERKTPYHHTSHRGRFEVVWPSGCGRLRVRENGPGLGEETENEDIVVVQQEYCDQNGQKGRGCSVISYLGARKPDGSAPGPEQVLGRVRSMLKGYGVAVTRQAPVRREFEDGRVVEGVDVFGTGPDGRGEFRVRGLLSGRDIYILTAWSTNGDMWDHPEFLDFFDKFVPTVE